MSANGMDESRPLLVALAEDSLVLLLPVLHQITDFQA
jgi:hypothetical protein